MPDSVSSKPKRRRTQQTVFHFVTGVPQTETEKRNVRTIVRSNASNRRWRLARETADASSNENQNESTNHAEAVLSTSCTTPSFPRRSSSTHDQPDSIRSLTLQQRRHKQLKNALEGKHHAVTASDSCSLVTPSPLADAQLTRNIFSTMPPSDVSRKNIDAILRFTALSYAQLFPAGADQNVSTIARDWFQRCFADSGVLHTALYCQAMRTKAVKPEALILSGNEVVLCQTEAVHTINKKFQHQATACDDEMLRIVFSLTWHKKLEYTIPTESPCQTPMASLTAIGMFMGVVGHDPAHAAALDQMIAMRGGLGNVTMPGLAFLISIGDILWAACQLTCPKWTYGSYADCYPPASPGREWANLLSTCDVSLCSLATGFHELYLWMPVDHAQKLHTVFLQLADYTRATDIYIKEQAEAQSKATMADQRNSVTHALLSLAPVDSDGLESDDFFKLCWHVGVAYCFISVFVLAPHAARFDRLALRIRSLMTKPVLQGKFKNALNLTLWCTVVGGICSVGTEDRVFFVSMLSYMSPRMGLSSWEDVEVRLLKYLWFPSVSNSDGLQLWEEARATSQASSSPG